MSITFIGDVIPETERLITGFHSLDKALGNKATNSLGFPLKTLVEVFGPNGIGKTTFVLSMGGMIANHLGGKIALADFEGQSRDTLVNALEMGGFLGELDMLTTAKTSAHYEMLDNMLAEFKNPDCNVALVDSIGAFMPPGEEEGSVVDANMGQRPRIIGNWTRKIVNILSRPQPKICMYISHQHSNIGFVGTHTSGGETKAFLNAVQISLKRKDSYETGWLLEGKVTKNRYGKAGEFFYVFCIGGQGIHRGLSAVFDCVSAGKAEIERNVVRMDGQSYGKVARMIETHQDTEQFAPFINALQDDEEIEQTEKGLVSAADLVAKMEEPKKKGRKKK